VHLDVVARSFTIVHFLYYYSRPKRSSKAPVPIPVPIQQEPTHNRHHNPRNCYSGFFFKSTHFLLSPFCIWKPKTKSERRAIRCRIIKQHPVEIFFFLRWYALVGGSDVISVDALFFSFDSNCYSLIRMCWIQQHLHSRSTPFKFFLFFHPLYDIQYIQSICLVIVCFFLLLFRCYQFFIFSPRACSDWSTQTWFFFPLSIQSIFIFRFFFLPHFLHKFFESYYRSVCVPCCNRTQVTFTLCFSFPSSIIVDWHQHTVLYNIYIHIGCGNTSSFFGIWQFFKKIRSTSSADSIQTWRSTSFKRQHIPKFACWHPQKRSERRGRKNHNIEDSMATKDQNRKMLVKFMRVFLFRDVFIYHTG